MMGSSPSLSARETRNLSDLTGFSSEQIEILHRRFLHLTDGKSTMTSSFDNIPDLDNNPIKSRIVNAFFDGRNLGLQSKESVDEITFENFLTTLSFFQHLDDNHPKEDLEHCKTEKLKFLFRMYDTNGDGKITLEELREIVDELLSKKFTTEKASSSIADSAMLEAANICVGQMEPNEHYEGITFQDFLQIMQELKIESKMHVRFLQMDTTAMCK
ncbi:calcineurin B homologous protein 3-like isoform X2 [Pristis pectinata]|uniref:calcineurin B homologous protein 3-like isoform X2 n=1 Tax=Pristis pectinata TaxID=685728 RepID=UPI00223E3EC8|nr:calcineurin B homologous protein 3-like isoform X2 [Pristis pectinata]